MKMYKCRHCCRLTYPAHYVCRQCHHTDFEEIGVSEGTLLTYTVIHVPPPGVDSPLRIGIVEFEGGIRALGKLMEPTEVGSKVRAEWGVTRKVGEEEYEGFTFRPA